MRVSAASSFGIALILPSVGFILLSGGSCARKSGANVSAPARDGDPAARPSRVRVGEPVTQARDTIEVSIVVTQSQPAALKLSLNVRSLARRSITLSLRGRPPGVVFTIKRAADGTAVWTTPGDGIFSVNTFYTLVPGESVHFDQEWDRRDRYSTAVAPGTYTISAVLPTMSGEVFVGDVRFSIFD